MTFVIVMSILAAAAVTIAAVTPGEDNHLAA